MRSIVSWRSTCTAPLTFEITQQLLAASDSALLTLKLDGSLVSPLLLSGEVHWATRRQVSAHVSDFARTCPAALHAFSRHWLEQGVTPIFEFCERLRAVGVVQHAASSLTLLALRDNVSGQYLPRTLAASSAAAFGVDLVPTLPLAQFMASRGAAVVKDEGGGS